MINAFILCDLFGNFRKIMLQTDKEIFEMELPHYHDIKMKSICKICLQGDNGCILGHALFSVYLFHEKRETNRQQ